MSGGGAWQALVTLPLHGDLGTRAEFVRRARGGARRKARGGAGRGRTKALRAAALTLEECAPHHHRVRSRLWRGSGEAAGGHSGGARHGLLHQ